MPGHTNERILRPERKVIEICSVAFGRRWVVIQAEQLHPAPAARRQCTLKPVEGRQLKTDFTLACGVLSSADDWARRDFHHLSPASGI